MTIKILPTWRVMPLLNVGAFLFEVERGSRKLCEMNVTFFLHFAHNGIMVDCEHLNYVHLTN